MLYSLDEVGLIPAIKSEIRHRGEVTPYVQSPFGGIKLPVFVAPMTCILNANNICEFSRSKFEPILPVIDADVELRTQLPNGSNWLGWTAMTLAEFKSTFNACKADENKKHYILIDVANGHMAELFQVVKDAKQEYGDNLIVMIGNIANPETYIECCKARADYVRVGIGGGAGCTTSVQTGIHASIPWILEGIKKIKGAGYLIPTEKDGKTVPKPCLFKEYIAEHEGVITKVVADGGINTIAKAIKCLALGADYVMMGKCFAECEEAGNGVVHYFKTKDLEGKPTVEKQHLYYGQSSKEGQLDRFGKVKSNPEGLAKWIPITTNLNEFADKFEAALRSAMSYCGAKTLSDFIGKVNYEYMTPSEFSAFIK